VAVASGAEVTKACATIICGSALAPGESTEDAGPPKPGKLQAVEIITIISVKRASFLVIGLIGFRLMGFPLMFSSVTAQRGFKEYLQCRVV
jgi:hypothetical protein